LSAAEIAVIALAHTGQWLPESFQTQSAVRRLIELRLVGPTDNNLNCAVCNYWDANEFIHRLCETPLDIEPSSNVWVDGGIA
jgi:hypothetical protein